MSFVSAGTIKIVTNMLNLWMCHTILVPTRSKQTKSGENNWKLKVVSHLICFYTIKCASLWLTVFSLLVRGCVRPLVKKPRTGYISGAKAWFMLTIAKGLFSFISYNHIFIFYQYKRGKYELTGKWPYCYPLWLPYIDRSFYPNCIKLSCYVLQSYAHNFICRIVFLFFLYIILLVLTIV